jgi:hypothetical protein
MALSPRQFVLVMAALAVTGGIFGWQAFEHGGPMVETVVGWSQLIVGTALISLGFAYRHSDVRANRTIGPLGVVWLVSPLFKFLPGGLPLGVRITLALLGWVVAAVWYVRARRPVAGSVG